MRFSNSYLQQQKLLELTSRVPHEDIEKLSTIVEIIRAYQPLIISIFDTTYLQQQKLLELTSPSQRKHLLFSDLQQQKLLELTSPLQTDAPFPLIYNSRNYQSLLARLAHVSDDIIYNSRNYQSLLAFTAVLQSRSISTIVEIIRAYQPKYEQGRGYSDLQQQKLLELTSLSPDTLRISVSTIVEIIRAYQPTKTTHK